MKTPIAIYNLWHQGTKTLVSIGGVAFALLLVFMQLGFMGAVEYTARNVLDRMDFDILLRPNDYLHLYEASTLDRRWLRIAESTDGVASATPFWVMIQNWRKLPGRAEMQVQAGGPDSPAGDPELGPLMDFNSQYLPIAIMAFHPDDQIFLADQLPELQQARQQLNRADTLLLDDSTKADYGPWDGLAFGQEDVELSQNSQWSERRPEIGGVEYEIAGLFELGTGLAANAGAIMGQDAFARISPWDVQTTTSLGLIKLHDPSPDEVARVLALLKERLQVEQRADQIDRATSAENTVVSVLSRDEAIEAEKNRWLWDMPIGLIFQMGVAISLLVGSAIVYMVLSTDVANRLPEYATLLAMGYSRKYLAGIVMTQAVVLCALGFLSALVGAQLLYQLTSAFSGIPLRMTLVNIVLVGVLGLVMCCVSGLLALRKLWKAEPASLF